MSTVTKPAGSLFSEPQPEEVVSYRSVSKAAIFSVCLAVLGLGGLIFPGLLALEVVALVLGILAIRGIKRYPDELIGLTPAIIGTVLGAVVFSGGIAWHVYEYASELPEGYTSENRVDFADLQPEKTRPDLPVSPKSLELDGQKIFVKGYIHPEYSRGPVKKFVIVPDMGTCCFGGQPKLTDMIEVTLRDPLRVRYSQRMRKLAGVLKVDTRPKPVTGLGGVYYQLDAEYVQ
jgi:hypothetical protein